jgi:hypothetical protein
MASSGPNPEVSPAFRKVIGGPLTNKAISRRFAFRGLSVVQTYFNLVELRPPTTRVFLF